MKLHSLPRRRVCPMPDVPADHFVSFSEDVFDLDLKIGHCLIHAQHHLFITLNAGWLSAGSIVVVESGRHLVANDFRFSLVHELFKMLDYKLLHFGGCKFSRHALWLAQIERSIGLGASEVRTFL